MERTELETVIYEKDDAIARIILNFPEKANVQSAALVWDVDSCLKDAESDNAIKVVVLKANGKGFCAGHALGDMLGSPSRDKIDSGFPGQFTTDLYLWPVLHMWEFPKPLISQVHGYAIGGGTYFALIPDIVVASEDAYFQMPLVQGIGLPGGETMIEPWVFMNYHRTFEYLYLGQTLTAREALDMGIINRVVQRDELEQTVEAIARQIAAASLSTLMGTKHLVKQAWELMGVRTHWQMSNNMVTLLSLAPEAIAWRAQHFPADAPLRPRQIVADRVAHAEAEGGA